MGEAIAFRKGLMSLIEKIPKDGKYVPVHGVAVMGLQVAEVEGQLVPRATFWTSMGYEATLLMLAQVQADIQSKVEAANAATTDEHPDLKEVTQVQEGVAAAITEDALRDETVQ